MKTIVAMLTGIMLLLCGIFCLLIGWEGLAIFFAIIGIIAFLLGAIEGIYGGIKSNSDKTTSYVNQIAQITCTACGEKHDADDPKCPFCGHMENA